MLDLAVRAPVIEPAIPHPVPLVTPLQVPALRAAITLDSSLMLRGQRHLLLDTPKSTGTLPTKPQSQDRQDSVQLSATSLATPSTPSRPVPKPSRRWPSRFTLANGTR